MNAAVWAALLFTPLAARLFARGDRAGIRELYWRTAAWMAVFSFPVFALTFVCAHELTVALFGERYASSAPVLALLALGYAIPFSVAGYYILKKREVAA